MREKGKGTRESGKGHLSWRYKGLPLDREETDVAHRKMEVYKGTRGRFRIRTKCLISIGHVI